MAHIDPLIADDIDAYLHRQQHKSLLRFITCGSVDDGKSTLIGRFLYESKLVFEDHLAALEADSKKVGTQGGELDFALLVDGLAAEREQGITIDVAYRFFSTETRKFVVADTPGHEQYTRNMVTGASTAEVAVILVDARKGILTQTRRHSYLVSLLGIRHVVLAVNKLDLVDYSQEVFDSIDADYRAFAAELGVQDIVSIPLSALRGDNVTEASPNTPWYSGPTLMEYLEAIEVDDDTDTQPFRFVAQWVNRPNLDFRGYSGVIVGGTVRTGDRIRVVPSGRREHHQSNRHLRRRPRRGRGRGVGDPLPGRRGRRQPGRRDRRGDSAAFGGRPVRDPRGLDERRRDAAGAPLPGEDRRHHLGRHRRRAQVPGERQHVGAHGRQDARAEPDRRVQPHAREGRALRSLHGQP